MTRAYGADLKVWAASLVAVSVIARGLLSKWSAARNGADPHLPRRLQPPPRVAADVVELIGDTPLVRLHSLSELTQCDIYGKLELMNPGGSAKDRIARAIVEHAEREGRLRPGHSDRVFEGTSGSTGISLALVCRAKGYEAHIVIPDDTSADKVRLLEMYGATVHMVRPAGIADGNHYVNVARRLADEVNSAGGGVQAVFANQFEDEQNWRSHHATTGPEIYAQAPGITCFVSGAGTGGTIAGVGTYLKEQSPDIRVVLADVPGSGLYNKVHYGVMFNNTEKEGRRRRHQVDTIVEGIGLNRVTRNLVPALACVTDAERVADADARYMADVLVQREGLFVGSSSAVNCVAAFRQARKLGPGQTIVTVLCDSGTRHVSKFYGAPVDPGCVVAAELGQDA